MNAFCEKVIEYIKSDKHLQLLEYIHEHSAGRITVDGVKAMVKDLLGECPGLFYEFLLVFRSSDGLTPSMKSVESGNKRNNPDSERIEETDGYYKKIRLSFKNPNRESPDPRNKVHLVQMLEFCEKVRKKTSSEQYLALLKCLHDYANGKIAMVGVKIMIADYFSDFMDDFNYVLEFYERILTQPSSENELTPSYNLLPNALSGVHGSCATELDREVLNSSCYSKGSYGFKRVWPKDNLEKMLNDHEDELFKKDMGLAWFHSTHENATKLKSAMKKGTVQKNPTLEDVREYFTSYNLTYIEKLYEKDGPFVMNQLRQSPKTVLPVIFKRLEKMDKEMKTS